jgi:TPR repeat protein
VEKDPVKAVALYRTAANAGNVYAQFMLGRCYEGGIGIGQDKYAAVKWYKKAAAQGFKYAAQRAAALEQEFKKLVR